MAGLVRVDGQMRDKAGMLVASDADIALKQRPRFVSRAGEKLAYALETFAVDVTGVSALDVGASTGGFVDCLLQAGARRVIALDVGRGQLDGRLRNDPLVHPVERVNARYLTSELLPFIPDLFTMDISFISVSKVLPAVMGCMAPGCRGLVLVKPQFEAGPHQVGKGGIVRDPEVHREVLLNLGRFVIVELDARLLGVCGSGLPGTNGNVEFFLHLVRGGESGWGLDTLEAAVDTLVPRVSNDGAVSQT
jgi:23S rRNA (cytidine1920-2'-O)/16S rRNA (cytidine1409-2'-O)-methyltransferase